MWLIIVSRTLLRYVSQSSGMLLSSFHFMLLEALQVVLPSFKQEKIIILLIWFVFI